MRTASSSRFATLGRRVAVSLCALYVWVAAATSAVDASFTEGKPDLLSISALGFHPDGVLFLGDSKGGAVFALKLEEPADAGTKEGIQIADIETKIAARLGTRAPAVMIHDMAVHPKSGAVYLAVSRGRTEWTTRWHLPNDIADATILLRVGGDGEIREIPLEAVSFDRIALPKPVDADKAHRWKEGISLRADTITDLAFEDDVLYVAGLSNEEFASTMWRVPFPFESATMTTLEVFHGAHGEYETHAPIRTFVPYRLKGESHLLAAYLCTPFVTFPVDGLEDEKHLRGRTIAEFGSGNYPLDMVAYEKDGEPKLLIANSNLPMMIVDPKEIESYEGEIVTESETYAEGVPYEIRSGVGVQQLDLLNPAYFVALQRLPGGSLDLVSLPVRRF